MALHRLLTTLCGLFMAIHGLLMALLAIQGLLMAIQGLLTALRQLDRQQHSGERLPARTRARCGRSRPREMLRSPPASCTGPRRRHSRQPLAAHVSRSNQVGGQVSAWCVSGESAALSFAQTGSCTPVLGGGIGGGLLPTGKWGCCSWGERARPRGEALGQRHLQAQPVRARGAPAPRQQAGARRASPATAPAGAERRSAAGAHLPFQPPLSSRPRSRRSPPY